MTVDTSPVAKRGIDLLRDPQLNKSTAFTEAERDALGLTGLLPAAVDSEETQVRRALQQLGQKPTDLERYIYLIQLLDADEAHSVGLARAVPEIERCVVSTDDEQIAEVARSYGGDVPFLRPAELAADETPMAPVLRHALAAAEESGERFDAVVLLMPTTPVRRAEDISAAVALLAAAGPDVDGIVSVSEPPFNPAFVGVREGEGGLLARFVEDAAGTVRRQDADRFLRVNGLFYVWRAEFVRRDVRSWLDEGRHIGYRTDDFTALDIDTAADFDRLERLVAAGVVALPAQPASYA